MAEHRFPKHFHALQSNGMCHFAAWYEAVILLQSLHECVYRQNVSVMITFTLYLDGGKAVEKMDTTIYSARELCEYVVDLIIGLLVIC